eukprot:731301_1
MFCSVPKRAFRKFSEKPWTNVIKVGVLLALGSELVEYLYDKYLRVVHFEVDQEIKLQMVEYLKARRPAEDEYFDELAEQFAESKMLRVAHLGTNKSPGMLRFELITLCMKFLDV